VWLSLCVPLPLSHSPLFSLYPSDRQVTCDPPGEAALWVKHTEFGFSLCPSPTLPLYHSPTLPLSPSPPRCVAPTGTGDPPGESPRHCDGSHLPATRGSASRPGTPGALRSSQSPCRTAPCLKGASRAPMLHSLHSARLSTANISTETKMSLNGLKSSGT